jgi:hypothetical protein
LRTRRYWSLGNPAGIHHRLSSVLVYAVIDDSLSPRFLLGDSLDVFVRREDAERFIEEVRGDEPELACYLRIEEREFSPERFPARARRAPAA